MDARHRVDGFTAFMQRAGEGRERFRFLQRLYGLRRADRVVPPNPPPPPVDKPRGGGPARPPAV